MFDKFDVIVENLIIFMQFFYFMMLVTVTDSSF